VTRPAPRVVLGAPLYGQAGPLRAALESLLAQTFTDFRLVLVDDRSPDDTLAVAREHAAADPRVEVHENPRRLGMLANTNRAFGLARAAWPEAPYWALASDHDLWAPTWLERLVDALDARPEAVLAYPLTCRIDAGGTVVRGPWRFDTAGVDDPRERVRRSLRAMVSGDMIYGLFRASALDRTGFYRPVLAPDRLLLGELARLGQFVQVPELLWARRYVGLAALDRQRRAFWPDGDAPLRSHLPWWLVHAGAAGRREGAGAALRDWLPSLARFQARARVLQARDAALGPPVRAVLRSPRVRRVAGERALPAVRETRAVLERLLEEAGER
jgi:glycosyltransferase involved in cell wall biosynthesis